MVYYKIGEVNIPAGNFAFIYDVTKSEELFKKFYEAEKNLKVDYVDCAHKLRMAYEAFAVYEEAKKRSNMELYKSKSLEQIKEDVITEIKQPASIINYKNIIIELCDSRSNEFAQMLFQYEFARHVADKNEIKRKLKQFIRYLYSFGSESSHENINIEAKYVPNKENCIKVMGAFHTFLSIYYGNTVKFDSTLVPIKDYIPVPKNICEEWGLSLDIGKNLFVKDKRSNISYYILSSDSEGITTAQRRDIDTINKLWEDNFEDPTNIIRQTEYISGSNGDYRFQVYSLPNRPMKLTYEMVSKLGMPEKIDIILGICRGVLTIHSYKPSLFHRNISPDAFYIFDIKGKYKALLAKFDCIKDTANADFTVFYNVEKRVQNQKTNQFFAPEVLASDMGQDVDWEKADIYSLAKTCLYIMTGEIIETLDDTIEIDNYALDAAVKNILLEMLNHEPQNRPHLSDLMHALGAQ